MNQPCLLCTYRSSPSAPACPHFPPPRTTTSPNGSQQGRLTLASIGKRSTLACAAVALLPGAMSFLRAAGLGGGAGSNFGGGLRNTARGFYASTASTGGNMQARYTRTARSGTANTTSGCWFRWTGGGGGDEC